MTPATPRRPTPFRRHGGWSAATRTVWRFLVDFIALSLTAKQAHWNIVGTNFRDLHLNLDEVTDIARAGLTVVGPVTFGADVVVGGAVDLSGPRTVAGERLP